LGRAGTGRKLKTGGAKTRYSGVTSISEFDERKAFGLFGVEVLRDVYIANLAVSENEGQR
jgi:hypothetical protein